MSDIAAALEYVAGRAAQWKIRPSGWVIGGHSAGAHLALLYSYKFDLQKRISAVIDLAGPTDFTDTDWLNYRALLQVLPAIENLVDAKYQPGQPLHANFSLASRAIGLRDLPTLIIHGTADPLVLYGQASRLSQRLADQDIDHKLVTLDAAGHDLGISNPDKLKLILRELSDWCFLYGK